VNERGITLWCGLHTRDRSVPAERSQLLSGTPSYYVLPDTCQGIVGHWEGDFDFHRYPSQLIIQVTDVLIYYRIHNTEVPSNVYPQIGLSGIDLTIGRLLWNVV
jgi:hypothetical protein